MRLDCDPVHIAIQRLQAFEPPELVRFIRERYPDVVFDLPELSMWQLIVKKNDSTNTAHSLLLRGTKGA